MSVLMTITAAVVGGVAIWGSVLGCKVLCCGRPTTGVRSSLISRFSLLMLVLCVLQRFFYQIVLVFYTPLTLRNLSVI